MQQHRKVRQMIGNDRKALVLVCYENSSCREGNIYKTVFGAGSESLIGRCSFSLEAKLSVFSRIWQ